MHLRLAPAASRSPNSKPLHSPISLSRVLIRNVSNRDPPRFVAPPPQLTRQLTVPQNLSGGSARLQPSYPVLETPGHDPVQNLLDSYPSPQTENQKIVKMLEIIAGHVPPPPNQLGGLAHSSRPIQIQEHHKRFNNFVVNMEERLGGLEAAVSQLVLNDPELSKRMEACGRREDKERESQKERERSTSRHHISGSSTSGKKKKKTKTTPDHETELYTRSAAGTSSRDVAGEEVLPVLLLFSTWLDLLFTGGSAHPRLTKSLPVNCKLSLTLKQK